MRDFTATVWERWFYKDLLGYSRYIQGTWKHI